MFKCSITKGRIDKILVLVKKQKSLFKRHVPTPQISNKQATILEKKEIIIIPKKNINDTMHPPPPPEKNTF